MGLLGKIFKAVVPVAASMIPGVGSVAGPIAGALVSGGGKAAKGAAQATEVRPYSGTSGLGSVGYNNSSRTFTQTAAPNPFTQLLNMLGPAALANAGAAPGSAFYGASPEIVAAARGLEGPQQFADARNRYGLLTQLAAPEMGRSFNSLQNTLFSRGQLGSTGGGEQMRGFYEAQNDADLKRQLASQDWASNQAMNRFNTALSAVGAGQATQLQNYNIGTGAMGGVMNLFSALSNMSNTGVAAGGGQNAQAAMMAAQAQNSVPQAIFAGLQSSGILDGLRGAISGGGGGGSKVTADMLQPVQVTSRYI